MKPMVEVTLIELAKDDRDNPWFIDYAVLIDAGRGQKLVMATYPDYWGVYIKKLPIYNFYYN